MISYAVKGIEQTSNVAIGLLPAPPIPRIPIDFVDSERRRFLYADLYPWHSCQVRLRAITSAAVNGLYDDSGAA